LGSDGEKVQGPCKRVEEKIEVRTHYYHRTCRQASETRHGNLRSKKRRKIRKRKGNHSSLEIRMEKKKNSKEVILKWHHRKKIFARRFRRGENTGKKREKSYPLFHPEAAKASAKDTVFQVVEKS